jgi:hypothetical protein
MLAQERSERTLNLAKTRVRPMTAFIYSLGRWLPNLVLAQGAKKFRAGLERRAPKATSKNCVYAAKFCLKAYDRNHYRTGIRQSSFHAGNQTTFSRARTHAQ